MPRAGSGRWGAGRPSAGKAAGVGGWTPGLGLGDRGREEGVQTASISCDGDERREGGDAGVGGEQMSEWRGGGRTRCGEQ